MAQASWLSAALDAVPRWLAFQMGMTQQPGCVVAIAHKGRPVLQCAIGHADLPRGLKLTPRHAFRVASHSKSFTAAGILRLRDQGRLGLDDAVGRHVDGLHPEAARATLAQLLSHSAGLVRDGADARQWAGRRPFLDAAELRVDLAAAPTLEAGTRFKYSNHGYGLLGLVIEALTGEPYAAWIARELLAPLGLAETWPDVPGAGLPRAHPLAAGHTGRLPLGERLALPSDTPTRALAPATGFVGTAADLLRFYASLAPDAPRGLLSVGSRREMTRRLWLEPHSALGRWYGLGTISGTTAGWEHYGHSGSFPGTLTRTAHVPSQQLGVAVFTNAADGPCQPWLDGVLHLLAAHWHLGGPSRATRPWSGRWWALGAAVDLLPMGDRVLVANPALANPVQDASHLAVEPRLRAGSRHATIALAGGFASHGEPARLEHDAAGKPVALWLGGAELWPEARLARELRHRYGRRRS